MGRLRSLMRSSGRGVILKSIQRSTGRKSETRAFAGTTIGVVYRNHYVHGGKPPFDYNRNFDAVVFFTDTLELVFATSDRIEAGWDVKAWSKTDMTMSQPFGRYLVTTLSGFRCESSPAVNAAPQAPAADAQPVRPSAASQTRDVPNPRHNRWLRGSRAMVVWSVSSRLGRGGGDTRESLFLEA